MFIEFSALADEVNVFTEANVVLFFNQIKSSGVKVGVPALFLETANNAELFEAPTMFLLVRYVSSGSLQSHHTWAKAAYGLKSWFEYLIAISRDWRDAGEQDRVNFRDAYLSAISPKTGKLYGSAGVRDTLTTIREFYRFCASNRFYTGDIGATHTVELRPPIDRNFLSHTSSTGCIRDKDYVLPKARPGVKIHPILTSDLRSLLNHVGPQAAHRDGDIRSARDRLICDIGWVVGLRLDEINRLTTLQFLRIVPDAAAPYTNIPLTIHNGKGNKSRQVAIPGWLVADVLAYIDGERRESIAARKVGTKKQLFNLLLAHGSSKSPGQPITNSAIQKMFRHACLSLGIVQTVQKEEPLSGVQTLTQVPKHSIHDLRHTYAVLTYHAERANGNAEPWKKIQAQLGHSQLQTTIDTYLSHVEIFTNQSGLLDVRRMLGL